MAIRSWLIVSLLTSQPAVAGQRVLLIRGLMDYLPGISPMRSLQARLTSEGYDVTMITHLTDGFYKNAYWDAVIGHSQGRLMPCGMRLNSRAKTPNSQSSPLTHRGRASCFDASPVRVT
jgi:hypothetical protein